MALALKSRDPFGSTGSNPVVSGTDGCILNIGRNSPEHVTQLISCIRLYMLFSRPRLASFKCQPLFLYLEEVTMKMLSPSVELIQEENPYKKIEIIGRLCYKSENKITYDSCYRFVYNLIHKNHFAMLEHARCTFTLNNDYGGIFSTLINIPAITICRTDTDKIFVNVSMSHLYNSEYSNELFIAMRRQVELYWLPTSYYDLYGISVDSTDISYNLTYLVDNLECPITKYPELHYASIKFLCDRGVSHELVRHRCAVAQTSTRYCNYSKNKFGNQISYVTPSTYHTWDASAQSAWNMSLNCAEESYMKMLTVGCSPEQARSVLPNSLATEVVLTMNIPRWKHFFDIRYLGTTGNPHPDMKYIARLALQALNI